MFAVWVLAAGDAAASSGSNMFCAAAMFDGIAMAALERLLFKVLKRLVLTLLTLLFSTVKASLLKMAGSIVYSSGMAVAYIGRLYADLSSMTNLGGDMVFEETGGESL